MTTYTSPEDVPASAVVIRDREGGTWQRIGASDSFRPASWVPIATLAEIIDQFGPVTEVTA